MDLDEQYRGVEEPTFRIPTPPRINVPVETPAYDKFPDLYAGANGRVAAPDAQHGLPQPTAVPAASWSYNMRREAQAITPFLFLGPMSVAKDIEFLRTTEINLILVICHPMTVRLLGSTKDAASDLRIHFYSIEVADNSQLIAKFTRITDHITLHIEWTCNAKVLVCCETGNDRSAGAVAAWLMNTYPDMSYILAMQFLYARRGCVNFDDNMKSLLQGYDDLVRARRDVEDMEVRDEPDLCKRSAKCLNDDEEGDHDMDVGESSDAERFQGRAFHSPFIDA